MAPLRQIPFTFHQAPSPDSSQRPVIVFVHHYDGSEKTLKRHSELVTRLGFDNVTFNLSANQEGDGINLMNVWRNFPQILLLWSAQKRWALEVRNILNQLPDRPKIIFAFSGPSACAIRAIASRFKRGIFDVVGFICDSGPFYDPWPCTRQMLIEVHGMTKAWPREPILAFMMTRWDLNHKINVRRGLAHIHRYRPDFPILSLQGAQDTIVPPEQIQPVFKGMEFTRYTECVLEKAGHLTGLKNEPAIYEEIVEKFLASLTQAKIP